MDALVLGSVRSLSFGSGFLPRRHGVSWLALTTELSRLTQPGATLGGYAVPG